MGGQRRTAGLVAFAMGVALVALSLAAGPARAADVVLPATGRDFEYDPKVNAPNAHPDFENIVADDPGIVTDTLGGDGKPVYDTAAHPGGTVTTESAASFNQWFHDDPTVNVAVPLQMTFTQAANGDMSFDSDEFFPMDGKGWNDPSRPNPPQVAEGTHNFAFTLELHTSFTYNSGDSFTFTADDDLWIYVNNKRIIDLGGVHPSATETVALNDVAASAGITPGNTYNFDLFKTERHTTGSAFAMSTTFPLAAQTGPTTTTTVAGATTTTLAGGTTTTTTTASSGTTTTTTACTTAQLTAAPSTVPQRAQVVLQGTCFLPNQSAALTINSDPVSLGSVTTDSNGAFRITITLPSQVTPGAHTITAVTGTRQASAPLTVATFLPVMGARVSHLLVYGLLLMALGAALIAGTRRPHGAHYAI